MASAFFRWTSDSRPRTQTSSNARPAGRAKQSAIRIKKLSEQVAGTSTLAGWPRFCITLAMRVIHARLAIFSAKVRPTNASIDQMKCLHPSSRTDLYAIRSWHRVIILETCHFPSLSFLQPLTEVKSPPAMPASGSMAHCSVVLSLSSEAEEDDRGQFRCVTAVLSGVSDEGSGQARWS